LRSGAQAVAYPSIVASGPNACVLHYRDNNRQAQASDLLLIDAGCEVDGYASDITRTFPVSGKFSGEQKAIYELVLATQLACIDAVQPGRMFHDYHEVAERVLAQGLIDLKLCEGTLEGVLESGAYKQFYMHRAGHWLGLDVHDVGLYRIDGESRRLEPGMVLTVEPGCYIRPADKVPEEFWDIGVRIEDDVLVTAAGNENLTGSTPKTVADVDRAGVRIGVNKNSAYDLYLTRTLKNAQLVRGENGVELFVSEKLEATAGVKQPIAAYAEKHPEVRVMDGRFMEIRQAMGTPRPREAAAAYLRNFVEEMKASGFVADALKRSNQPDAAVAPAE